MPRISAEEILTNSPLNSGGKENAPAYERNMLSSIHSFIRKKNRFIIAIDGLRRVGKTTLLRQLLNKLQKEGRTVFYFAFDKKAHQNTDTLEDVAGFFLKKDTNSVICLDEIGRIDDWAGVIKKHYDRSNATFLLSSSAAMQIKKGSESLAGRLIDYTLPPLGFDEYLELKKAKSGRIPFSFSNPQTKSLFSQELSGFFLRGSYPELHGIDDPKTVKTYIRNSTIEKMIFEDIPSIFQISHPSKLHEIYEYFANYSGDFMHEKNISGLVGLSEPAVNDYITYLEKSHLVQRVFTQSNYAKQIRRKKKGYVASPSIYLNTTSNFSEGKLAETAVFDKLRGFSPTTYVDEQKREVDFLAKISGRIYPIEVKSGSRVSLSDLPSLLHCMKSRKCKSGFVIYNGPYDCLETEEKEVHLIPLSSFLASDIAP